MSDLSPVQKGIETSLRAGLLDFGALPFPEEAWADLIALPTVPEKNSPGLAFGQSGEQVCHEAEEMPVIGGRTLLCGDVVPEGSGLAPEPETAGEAVSPAIPEEKPCDAYSRVIDRLVWLLAKPREDMWLAGRMDVQNGRMKIWLKRALTKKPTEKMRKSGKYPASHPTLFSR